MQFALRRGFFHDHFQGCQKAIGLGHSNGRRDDDAILVKRSSGREANRLAATIRCHGECAEVIIEGADQGDPRKWSRV